MTAHATLEIWPFAGRSEMCSNMLLGRRTVLTGLLALGLGFVAEPGNAGTSPVRSVHRDERGTTLFLELEATPFPHGGAPYQDRTVIVFVPRSFRVERGGQAPMVVHFHGHRTTAERALASHQLREQLSDSLQNAVLVVPQGPLEAADSSAGKLETPGGLARLLNDVTRVLSSAEGRAALGDRSLGGRLRPGVVCLSAHSGGYHAAAVAARVGGIDVNEIYLFDALYGDLEAFRDWVSERRGRPMKSRHKLVSYYGAGATETNSRWLKAELERRGVQCAFENVEGTLSREELVRAEAIFVRTSLSHNGVTHELNALRDCLYASGLPRHQRTAWFDAKAGARPLERRR